VHVVEQEEGGHRVRRTDLAAPDQGGDQGQGHPLAAVGLEVVLGMADVFGGGGPVDVMAAVGQTVGGFDGEKVRQPARAPAGFFEHFPGRRSLDVLAVFDDSGGEFPAPTVGDEAVPPQQEGLAGFVDGGGQGDRTLADEVVVEVTAVGKFDVGEVEGEYRGSGRCTVCGSGCA
jgi:hypothetical protein